MKRLLILKCLLLLVACLFGQEPIIYSYLEGDGYTYVQKYVTGTNMVFLSNKDNNYIDVCQVYKDTGKAPHFDVWEKHVEDDNWSYDKSMAIINGAFSTDQRLSVRDRKLHVAIYIDSTTGRIVSVEFCYIKKGPFSKIPLSVFREIEVKLKEQVHFTLTEAGKKMNYVFLGWTHEVK